MKRCPARDALQQFLDEELAAAAREEIEVHTERCRTCQKLLAELVETAAPAGMANMSAPTATPTPAAMIERFAALAYRMAAQPMEPDITPIDSAPNIMAPNPHRPR